MSGIPRVGVNRRKGWSYRDELNERTATAMIANGSSIDDVTAIRTFSNDIMDELEKSGVVSRAESDRLSQRVTIVGVKRLMRSMLSRNFRADKYLNARFLQSPTFKTVDIGAVTPVDLAHVKFRGRLFATKENLNYRPSRVRLVEING